MMPVTIAIPFYNAEKYLPDAIRSVFAQTYTHWELILIDDGSTDRSLAIAKSVTDPRVRVISDGRNLRLANRLNQITRLARYDLIARMDADDLMSPHRIEKEVAVLEENPRIDLVTTGLFSVTNQLEMIGCRWNNKPFITHDELLDRNIVVHAAILARKSWYERYLYDASLKVAQDYSLWLRASFANDFHLHFIPEPLYYYREEGNVSLKKILLAGRYGRQLFREYGRNRKTVLIVQSYIKNILACICILSGMQSILLKRRGQKVNDREILKRFTDELSIIRSTPVPGMY